MHPPTPVEVYKEIISLSRVAADKQANSNEFHQKKIKLDLIAVFQIIFRILFIYQLYGIF